MTKEGMGQKEERPRTMLQQGKQVIIIKWRKVPESGKTEEAAGSGEVQEAWFISPGVHDCQVEVYT